MFFCSLGFQRCLERCSHGKPHEGHSQQLGFPHSLLMVLAALLWMITLIPKHWLTLIHCDLQVLSSQVNWLINYPSTLFVIKSVNLKLSITNFFCKYTSSQDHFLWAHFLSRPLPVSLLPVENTSCEFTSCGEYFLWVHFRWRVLPVSSLPVSVLPLKLTSGKFPLIATLPAKYFSFCIL